MKRPKRKSRLTCPNCGASFRRILYEVAPEGIRELAEDLSMTEEQVTSLIASGKIRVRELRLPEAPGRRVFLGDLGEGRGKVH